MRGVIAVVLAICAAAAARLPAQDTVYVDTTVVKLDPARVHGRPVRALVTMVVDYATGKRPPPLPFGVSVVAEPRP